MQVVLKPYIDPALCDVPSAESIAWLDGASVEQASEIRGVGEPICYADNEDFHDVPAGDSDVPV